MKRFDEFEIGEKFYSTCTITKSDLDAYLQLSQTKNIFLESDDKHPNKHVIPGRMLLAKIEGAFTRLPEIYGNYVMLVGTDGDPDWDCRSVRFLMPFYTGDDLKIEYEISDMVNVNDDFGRIYVDYNGTDLKNGNLVIVAKRNIYQIKKDHISNK